MPCSYNAQYAEYTAGRVVREIAPTLLDSVVFRDASPRIAKPYIPGRFGHITGFDVVEYDHGFDVVLMVRWCDGVENPIHPSRVEIL